MATEHATWQSLHPHATPRRTRTLTCPCGQELDCCAGHHCPRCGTSIATRAA